MADAAWWSAADNHPVRARRAVEHLRALQGGADRSNGATDGRGRHDPPCAGGTTVNTVLETREVTHTFGAVKAADRVSVQLGLGQIVGIVGPNGSGKTTFVNIVTGYVKPARGQVLFNGKN